MKALIRSEEWYPVYRLVDNETGIELEVDEATIQKWKLADQVFESAQAEMEAAVEAAVADAQHKPLTGQASPGSR